MTHPHPDNHAKTANWLLTCGRLLSNGEFRVLMAIHSRIYDGQTEYAISQRELVEYTGMSERQIRTHIESMEKKTVDGVPVLAVRRQGKMLPNIYSLPCLDSDHSDRKPTADHTETADHSDGVTGNISQSDRKFSAPVIGSFSQSDRQSTSAIEDKENTNIQEKENDRRSDATEKDSSFSESNEKERTLEDELVSFEYDRRRAQAILADARCPPDYIRHAIAYAQGGDNPPALLRAAITSALKNQPYDFTRKRPGGSRHERTAQTFRDPAPAEPTADESCNPAAVEAVRQRIVANRIAASQRVKQQQHAIRRSSGTDPGNPNALAS